MSGFMIIEASVKSDNLPGSIKAYCYLDAEGHIYICINECLCDEARIEAFLHELRHILRGDIGSDKTVAEIERGAGAI